MLQTIFFVLPLLAQIHQAQASDAVTYRIVKISGAKTAEVLRDGKIIKVSPQDELRDGDQLHVKISEIVEILTEDKSELVVTGDAKLQIKEDNHAVHALMLLHGRIVCAIHKMLQQPDGTRSFNFMISTLHAVMGVRGTQFVVEASEETQTSTFHIIDGVVDVAKDVTDLLTNNFVVATAGQLVAAAGEQVGTVVDTAGTITTGTASAAKTIVHGVTDTVTGGVQTLSKAMPFDVLGFVATVNSQLPEIFHLPFITGEDHKYSEAQQCYRLMSFELAPQSYFSRASTPDGGQYFGMGLSWNPTLHVIPNHMDLRAHLGNSRLFQSGHGVFGDIETKVLATAILKKSAFIEAGPVYRHYYQSGNGFGLAANTGIWLGDRKLLHLFDRFLFGVNLVGVPHHGLSWEYRFGMGMTVF